MHGTRPRGQALAGQSALVIGGDRALPAPASGRHSVSTATTGLRISFRILKKLDMPMPASASLLALAGIVGFALISMLLGVFS